MIQSLIVTNPKGEELTLDLFRPELSGLYIKNIDGLGPPSASINTQDVATIDGALYVGSRLESRNLTIELGMMDRPSVELNRLKAYRYFPTKRPVSVVVVTDNNKVKIEGYVESNEPDIFSDEESTKISIVCPDPYFYDIEPTQKNFSDSIPLFEFAFSNESVTENKLIMSELRTDTRSLIVYPGDGDTGINIRIKMLTDVRTFAMYDVFTRKAMKLYGNKMPSSLGTVFKKNDVIEINTVKGNKYVNLIRAGLSTNIISALDKKATWFQLTPGDNIFAYAADDGTNDEKVVVTFIYNVAHEGV